MANSYTLLWSRERCEQMKKQGQAGQTLTVLFGGPHQSEPRFRKFGVCEGDYLYPIRVSQGVLYILGRMRIQRLLSIEEYVARNPETFAGYVGNRAEAIFGKWLEVHPEKLYLAPTCTDEVALGEDGTAVGLEIAVPRIVLENMRFRSAQGERSLKYVDEGLLKSIVSLQGIYCLSDQSAQEFEALLRRHGIAA